MIIYSDSRLVPTDVNMMVLRNKENTGYIYVHRSLLEQSAIIQDLYEDNLPMLIKAVTGSEESRADVDYFFENVPSPVNYLAPFLLLIKSELYDIIDMYGALHVMSGQLNFRRMLKISPDMRSNPSFSLSIREEYQLAWDRFLLNSMPYNSDMISNSVVPNQGSKALPMNGTGNEATYDDVDEDCVGSDGNVYDDPLSALLFGGVDMDELEAEIAAELDAKEGIESDEEDKSSSVSEPEPEPEHEPEPEKPKTGIDALLGGTL